MIHPMYDRSDAFCVWPALFTVRELSFWLCCWRWGGVYTKLFLSPLVSTLTVLWVHLRPLKLQRDLSLTCSRWDRGFIAIVRFCWSFGACIKFHIYLRPYVPADARGVWSLDLKENSPHVDGSPSLLSSYKEANSIVYCPYWHCTAAMTLITAITSTIVGYVADSSPAGSCMGH